MDDGFFAAIFVGVFLEFGEHYGKEHEVCCNVVS
jgi:hypothetical protein